MLSPSYEPTFFFLSWFSPKLAYLPMLFIFEIGHITCSVMIIFGTPAKLRGMVDMPLHINNEVVEMVEVFKYLGLFLEKI